jgi:hypothetical protein
MNAVARRRVGRDTGRMGTGSFQRYLTEVASTLRALAAEAGVPVADLPKLVERPNSSPPKLVDEYNWVVRTRRCPPPTLEEVLRWAEWARQGQQEPATGHPVDGREVPPEVAGRAAPRGGR